MDQVYTDKLFDIISGISPIALPTVQLIVDNGSFQAYERNQLVFAEKRYNAFEYFQLEGVAHRFNTDEAGQPVTTGIYSGGVVITPNFARMNNGQSLFSLQALTASTYLQVPIGTFDALRKQYPPIWQLGQRVIEQAFIRHLQFEVLFRSSSAKDRLLYFRANFPLLENLIPHTVIASFLGITHVSFSRLRHELAKQGG